MSVHMSRSDIISDSESLAKQLLDLHFATFPHEDNVRPSWLNGLEADRLYRPGAGIEFIIEFQGIQHDRPTPHFHKDDKAFQKQLNRDSLKQQLAAKRGVTIYRLDIYDLSPDRFRNIIQGICRDLITEANKRSDAHLAELTSRILHMLWYVTYPTDAQNHITHLQNYRVLSSKPPRPSVWRVIAEAFGWPKQVSRYTPK